MALTKKERRDKYRKTKRGVVSTIYHSQLSHSKIRGHDPPEYNFNELYEFAISNNSFHELYTNWVKSDYEKMIKPSFDRDDDEKPYSFDNFNCWMSWQENYDKAMKDMRDGKLINGHKAQIPVTGIHLITGEKTSFVSMSQAAREVGTRHCHISESCSGIRKQAGNHIWNYTGQDKVH